MIEINWSRCKTTPFDHQKVGVRELVADTNPARGRVVPNVFALFDQVGAGKTKQEIDSIHFLHDVGAIDTVVVVTIGCALSVWSDADPVLGEVAKHGWDNVPFSIAEYSSACKATETIKFKPGLNWIVTNYEFIRSKPRLAYLMKTLKGRKTWFVADEAWSVKSHTTKNWKACRAVRKLCLRATILNGSPVDGSPLDLYAQMNLLDPRILAVTDYLTGGLRAMTFTEFKARYAIEVPIERRDGTTVKQGKSDRDVLQVVSFQNLEELTAKTAPYILQRKTREVITLPPELEPIIIKATLTEPTWKLYTEMRDDMVAWIDGGGGHSIARQAIVKSLRLSQITSGFIGGVESLGFDPLAEDPFADEQDATEFISLPGNPLREIGREKLDATLDFLTMTVPDRPLVWCRFRPELERASDALRGSYEIFQLKGQQKKAERDAAKRALAPETVLARPTGVVGIESAGGASLNFSGSNLAIYLSSDFNLRLHNQSKGRIARPGQKRPFGYAYVIAHGPAGQKTIDHHIVKARMNKEKVADWTSAQWRAALMAA